MITLQDYLAVGEERSVGSMGSVRLGGLTLGLFKDAGLTVTVSSPSGVERKPSDHKGKLYTILSITDRTSFNPNQIRATLVIKYQGKDATETFFNKPVETYLDERFGDEFVGRRF